MTRSHRFLGISGSFRRVMRRAQRAAASDLAGWVIEGETGTGKTLLARWIHGRSRFARWPLEVCDPDTPDARRGQDVGQTLLLFEEISEFPRPALEALLDRVEGGPRFMATSILPLELLAEDRRLPTELLHRLLRFRIRIPPLRERREDIAVLLADLLARWPSAGRWGSPLRITDEARHLLLSYDYPGNVRELESLVRQGALFGENGLIDADDLTPAMLGAAMGYRSD